MSLKLCIFGETGQLARALIRQIDVSEHGAVFYSREAFDFSAPSCSVSDAKEMRRNLEKLIGDSDAVVIAAAYTAVDEAETQAELANQVNAVTPAFIAQYCKGKGVPLVHISTDYVFDGCSDVAYRPDSQTCPINVYGQSKLAGEKAIIESGAVSTILRTSWVFDAVGQNFLTTMLRLANANTELNVVGDQFGRPTYTVDLAQAVILACEKLCSGDNHAQGIFHVTGSGEVTSWAGFADAIVLQTQDMRPHKVQVKSITTAEYPTPAKRPAFSVLDVVEFEKIFDIRLRDWRDAMSAALIECGDKSNG